MQLKEAFIKMKKNKIVQTKNPITGHYIKINRELGKVVAHKKSEGAYKNIPIIIK